MCIRDRDDAHAVWVSQDEDGSRYAALFNLSEEPREVSLDLRELEGETFACRELWSGEERTAQETLSCVIEPHGARLFRCTECCKTGLSFSDRPVFLSSCLLYTSRCV